MRAKINQSKSWTITCGKCQCEILDRTAGTTRWETWQLVALNGQSVTCHNCGESNDIDTRNLPYVVVNEIKTAEAAK